MKVNDITDAVIGAAIEVHRFLGPGLLESTYIQCLCYELTLRKYPLSWRYLYQSFTKDSNSIVDIALTWLWPAL